ncbi:hypothetical protein Kpol_1014p12 [Vanderwaltozyma polyspora DSM 70294]|uniref:Uncharacterized protein n=1 Tax=Vanderwaltozyma polyspora (strain ATCC 22028 / DSM 70294 / BCRC 21397 / CBS 2163 / NBRC 10782 / NRRL Y-8283 / UCD 57-17) TaxID=436907 RepID=A7TNE1_VANPO|nr:uncharacterized protein Kpol_1014p12 [Vanderwaltozyma polyspora DSM 70294]EDO16194.1 hypothetical protein Kpol_1014p12 [Vanderwaltozyma polyspora DSM 70294]
MVVKRGCPNILRMVNVIIADFDETITVKDTISIVAKMPYIFKANKNLPEWSFFTDYYLSIYKQNIRNFKRSIPIVSSSLPNNIDDYYSSLSNEFNYQKFLKANIEELSIDKLTKYNVFKDISVSQVKQFARDPGCHDLVRKGFQQFLTNYQHHFNIISINWSKEFISNVIKNNCEIDIPLQSINCNDLLLDNGVYTGTFSRDNIVGSDKVVTLEKIITSNEDNSSALTSPNVYWYIGDSETDLLCLLHPRVNGILLLDPLENKDKFLRITRTLLNIVDPKLQEFIDTPDERFIKCLSKGSNNVYLAKDWYSINQYINSFK